MVVFQKLQTCENNVATTWNKNQKTPHSSTYNFNYWNIFNKKYAISNDCFKMINT